MKLDIKNSTTAAYSFDTVGYEFVYLVDKNTEKKYLLIDNRLSLSGFWFNDKQIANLIEDCFINLPLKTDNKNAYITSGDKIYVASYKHRGTYKYDSKGMPMNATPDVVRELSVINNK